MKGKKIIVFSMILIVLSPTLSSLLGMGDIGAINENRNKAGFPTYSEISSGGFSAVNSWYNDSFGMRDLFIRLQHQIDYSIFRHSKTLFFGGDKETQYLFYRSVIAEEQIRNEAMSNEMQNKIIDRFLVIKSKLEEQDISFRFIIAPQKNEILVAESEDIPVKRTDYNMYYVMQDKFLNSELKDNYVNIIDALKSSNEKIPTYYYSDFHWNDWGAACAFGEIVNSYAEELGKGEVYNPDKLEVSTFSPERNFAQLASLSVLYYDAPDEYTVNYIGVLAGEWKTNSDYPNLEIWENTGEAVFNDAVLMIGDSYTPPAISSYNETNSGIVTLFPRVYFCHWDNSEDVLNHIPDDVGLVVIETIESAYSYLADKIEPIY